MGLKITDKRTKATNGVKVGSDIPVGEVFYGKSLYGGAVGIFLRTYTDIVLLSHPNHTWKSEGLSFLDYRPVNAELVITD